jgi:hypothetical protein
VISSSLQIIGVRSLWTVCSYIWHAVQAVTDHCRYCYTAASQFHPLLQLLQTEGLKLEPDGELIPAEVVVANADLPYVELNLLPEQFSRKGLAEAAYSSGVVAFYWACDKQWPQLEHHTVFLSTDWESSWTRVFRDNKLGIYSYTTHQDVTSVYSSGVNRMLQNSNSSCTIR